VERRLPQPLGQWTNNEAAFRLTKPDLLHHAAHVVEQVFLDDLAFCQCATAQKWTEKEFPVAPISVPSGAVIGPVIVPVKSATLLSGRE
jgi:hypothetical protein